MTPLTAPAKEATGSVAYGPYRVVGQLGVGGMGVVHRAVHRETGASAALKTVIVEDPVLLAGLRREVRALSRLAHPGIVRIVDVALDDEAPWYAMELLEGQTLKELLHPDQEARETAPSGKLPRGEWRPGSAPDRARRDALLAMFVPLCDALAFLHGEGVIHLDLKPDNIFLTDGGPRIMDFGLAARSLAVHGREVLDVVGRGVGTATYMAPEQIHGAPLDARADLYALGCMLYEVITGRPPFTGHNSMSVVYGHLQREAPPPSALAPDVPPELDALVGSLLAKDPDARTGYAADVARELRALLPLAPQPVRMPRPRDYLYRPALVGRDAPVEALRAELARSARGETRVVFLKGESGVGKTRLAVELARRDADGFTVLTGECRSLGAGEARGAPLAPFDDVFHGIADRCRAEGPAETARLLGDFGRVLSPYAPALRQVPGAERWPEPEPLPARAARARLVGAMSRALIALAERTPTLILLDDVHWADDVTLAVLSALASQAGERAPLLVIATCRSEERDAALDELLAMPKVSVVSLARLDPEGAHAMASSMLGRAKLPPALVDRVSAHAEGNPFFIAEYLRAAVREEVLRRIDGRWFADDPDGARVASLPLPRSIRELVERRFERLSRLAGEVAQIAAVVGRDFAPDALAPHAGATEAALSDALQELLATQLFEALPGGRLRFAHAKLHEGVYERIAPGPRAALHVAVGEALERAAPEPGQAAILAHHYLEGRAHARALDQLERAGLEALASGSHSAAESHFERARALSEREGLTVSPLRQARFQRGLGDARFALGDLAAAAAHGRAVLALLGHALPESAVGAALALARESVALSPPSDGEAEALAEAALGAQRIAEASFYALDMGALLGGSVLATTLARRAGTDSKVSRAYAMLAVVIGAMRLRGPALRLAARALRAAEAGDDPTAVAYAHYVRSTIELGFRDFEATREAATESARLARAIGDQYDAGIAETLLGHCEYWTGDLAASAERYARLAREARECRAIQHEAWGLYAEARSLVHTGACARAVELCLEAERKLVGQNDAASDLICQALLAWALLGVGERRRARAAVDRARPLIESGAPIFANIPGYAAAAEVGLALFEAGDREGLRIAKAAAKPLATLALGTPLAETTSDLYAGRVALAEGKRRRAARLLRRALERADRHGMRLDAGMARRALARALDGAAARAMDDEGRAILEDIGARRHLEG